MTKPYPRDMVGYGGEPPDPKWPGGARLAVNFVLNYEEGSEYSIPDGDGASETILSESSLGAAWRSGAISRSNRSTNTAAARASGGSCAPSPNATCR